MKPELLELRNRINEIFPMAHFNGEGSYERAAQLRVSHPGRPTFYVACGETRTGRIRPYKWRGKWKNGPAYQQREWFALEEVVAHVANWWGDP